MSPAHLSAFKRGGRRVKSHMGYLFATFIGILFYGFGLGLLAYGAWNARRSTQAAAWPTTPATITHLEFHRGSDSPNSTYEVKILYRYSVDGVPHEGSRLAFGYTASSGRKAHHEIYRRLKDAKTILARYDPANPSVSCLSVGFHRSTQSILAFAVFWLLFTIMFTLLVWLSSRSDTVLLENLMVE